MTFVTFDYSASKRGITHIFEYFESLVIDYVSPADIPDNPRTTMDVSIGDQVTHVLYKGAFYGDPVSQYLPSSSYFFGIDETRPIGFKFYANISEFPDIHDFVAESYVPTSQPQFVADYLAYTAAINDWINRLDRANIVKVEFQDQFVSSRPLSGVFTSDTSLNPLSMVGALEFDSKIIGTRFDDLVQGGVGKNTFVLNFGHDIFDGDAGEDTAVFSGVRTDYIRTASFLSNLFQNGSTAYWSNKQNTEKLDATNVEKLRFSDGELKEKDLATAAAMIAVLDTIGSLLSPTPKDPILRKFFDTYRVFLDQGLDEAKAAINLLAELGTTSGAYEASRELFASCMLLPIRLVLDKLNLPSGLGPEGGLNEIVIDLFRDEFRGLFDDAVNGVRPLVDTAAELYGDLLNSSVATQFVQSVGSALSLPFDVLDHFVRGGGINATDDLTPNSPPASNGPLGLHSTSLLKGTSSGDTITVASLGSIPFIDASDGDDQIQIGNNAAIVAAGTGNDSIAVSDGGRAIVYGDNGFDTLFLSGPSSSYVLDFDRAGSQIRSGSTEVFLVDVEKIVFADISIDIQQLFMSEDRSAADLARFAVLRTNVLDASSDIDGVGVNLVKFENYFSSLISRAEHSTVPTLIVTTFLDGHIPSSEKLTALAAFSENQFRSYAAQGVASPEIGPYEALGVGFSDTTQFQADYALGTSREFIMDAYSDVFGRAASELQIQHFEDQVSFFEQLYVGAGVTSSFASIHARGAVIGQMLGFAALSSEQPYHSDAIALLHSAALGESIYGQLV